VRVAGDEIDQAIIKYLKQQYQVVVGENTAEAIKMQIGSAMPLAEVKRMTVRGRDLRTGMPSSLEIGSTEIYEAIKPQVAAVVQSVKMVLERTQPELAADLIDRGICMAGGTSQLTGLVQLLAQETGLPVRLAAEPMTCVARGCAALLENLDALKQILEVGAEG